MNTRPASPLRRRLLAGVAAGAAAPFWSGLVCAQGRAPIMHAVPASGETLPAIGVGSWITFNVPSDSAAAASLLPVLRSFFERGGAMIDSSPMYGYSETIIGTMLRQMPHPRLFSATKIWTMGKALGQLQFDGHMDVFLSGSESKAPARDLALDLLESFRQPGRLPECQQSRPLEREAMG